MVNVKVMKTLLMVLFLWMLPGCFHVLDAEPPFMPAVQARSASCTTDNGTRDKAWQTFRARFPYHYQTIALSKPFGDGCRTLVVAEPPPDTTLDGLKEAIGVDSIAFSTSRHRIGHDGWVADAVTVLPPLAEEDVASVVGELSRYVFKTAYKAYATPIDGAKAPAAGKLDVRVHPAEIKQWVFDAAASFRPVIGGSSLTTAEVMTPARAGIYYLSSQPVVAWSIPRGADITALAVEARQFALDSDVLFGAVANKDTVLILARERSVGVDELPPMRAETLALLASVDDDQLGQSYERNHILSGTYTVGKDWAPIYLSPQLIDTEYGSLLNITDQLLKSWSNVGLTTYANFHYPKPATWPFEKPVPEVLNADTLVYNWNTRGLGALFDFGDRKIFSARGTASHSVMYGVDDQPSREALGAETRAYEWFSGLSDPSLVRTVQYTVFYQIAHNLGLGVKQPSRVDTEQLGVDVLEKAVYDLLAKLRAATPETVKVAMEKVVGIHPGLTEEQTRNLKIEALLNVVKYKHLLEDSNDDELGRMAKILASPRENHRRIAAIWRSNDASQSDIVDALLSLTTRELAEGANFVQGLVDLDRVKDAYVAATLKRPSRWIRTPVVVVSSNAGSMRDATGGHNIDSKISRFEVGRGRGSRVIRPENLDRVVFSHEGTPTLGATPIALRSPSTALSAGEPRVEAADRGFAVARAGQESSAGWSEAPKGPSSGCGPGCISVRREGNGFSVVMEDRAVVANNRAAVADAIVFAASRPAVGQGPIRVELEGFNKRDGRNLLRTARRAKDVQFQAISHRRDVNAAKALQSSYDLSHATVKPAEFKAYADGTSAVGILIEVPPGAMDQPKGSVQVRTMFKQVVPESRLPALLQAAVNKVRESSGREVSTEEMNRRVRTEMRDVLQKTGVDGEIEVDFETPFGDIGISRRDQVGDHPGS